MQRQPKPMTSSELLEKTTELITSVKSLEMDFQLFLSDKEIGDDVDKLIEHQNQFWNNISTHISRIVDKITQNEADADNCRLLCNISFVTGFYNEKIFDDWSDLELRKLTIFLGIHNLQRLIKDQEPESETENLESTAGEISDSSQNVEIKHTASYDYETENVEDDLK